MLKARVMFATITGNNEAVANIIVKAFEKAAVDVTREQIELIDPHTITKANTDILVLVPYTFDLGSIPDEALDFYDDLAEVQLPEIVYGVAGSGDDYYGKDYCTAVDTFEARLSETGAKQGAPGVKVNLYPDQTDAEHLQAFVKRLLANFKN